MNEQYILLNTLSNVSFFPDLNNSWINYDFKYSLEEVKMTGATRINDSVNSKISILKNNLNEKYNTIFNKCIKVDCNLYSLDSF